MEPRPIHGLTVITNQFTADGNTDIIAAPGPGQRLVIVYHSLTQNILFGAGPNVSVQLRAGALFVIFARYQLHGLNTAGGNSVFSYAQYTLGIGDKLNILLTGMGVNKVIDLNLSYWVWTPGEQFQRGF